MTEDRFFEKSLHHIGFVVADIQKEIEGFGKSLAATWDGKTFHDPLQKAKVAFLRTECRSDALLELIEPADRDSPVTRFLQKGGGLHHLCYEVADLERHLNKMRAGGAVILQHPLPAVAFENRHIAWVGTRERLLLEFLERTRS